MCAKYLRHWRRRCSLRRESFVIAARTVQRRFDVDLNAGDVIHAVNLDDVSNVDQLRTSLDKLKSGDPVVLHVEREERMIYVGFEMD